MAPGEFFRWWGEQLGDCVPDRLRQHLQAQHTRLLLRTDGGDADVHIAYRGQSIHLGHHPELTRGGLATQLAGHPKVERIELTLAPGSYLARTVELPLAAADDLAQTIGYQIETLTPFKRDSIWLFCGEQERLPDGKRLRAWLVAVPRHSADLLSKLGLAPDPAPRRGPRRLPADGDSIELHFPPTRQAASRLPLGWVLAGLNIAALALAANLHLDNRQAELDHLKQQSRAIQEAALRASDLEHEVTALRERAERLHSQRASRPTSVAVLDEVSRRLDDDTWLQRFELRQRKLRLQGQSTNASSLIAELDRSPLLDDVRFDASLTRDPRGGGDRFNLTGQILLASGDDPQEATP